MALMTPDTATLQASAPETVQSISVVGTGAVGCYYGARLLEAGHDVRFLMRRDYDAVQRDGLRVVSHLGDYHVVPRKMGRNAEEVAAFGPPDWLLIALTAADLDELDILAAPLLAPHTRVLAVINGIGIEEDIAESLNCGSIFGGLGFIGVGQPSPGRIMHREFGALDIGHQHDDDGAVAEALKLWQPTLVSARPAHCLAQARWIKMLWDVPFNALSVVSGGANSDFILETPALGGFARRVMGELALLANADLEERGLPRIEDADAACERAMRLMGTTESYIPPAGVDFVRHRPLEVEAMFARPVRRAAELGVDVPLTAFLAAVVARLNPVSML